MRYPFLFTYHFSLFLAIALEIEKMLLKPISTYWYFNFNILIQVICQLTDEIDGVSIYFLII